MDLIKRIDRKPVYKGNLLTMYDDTILMPDGRKAHWDFLGHKGAAAVVAVRPDGKILMVNQFRNAVDRVTLEIPAGCKNEKSEPGEVCAARELEEETGYRVGKLTLLLKLVTAIAYCDETIDLYLAEDLTKTQQHLDEDEYMDVQACDLADLIAKIRAGEIRDCKTVAGLMAYYSLVQERKENDRTGQ